MGYLQESTGNGVRTSAQIQKSLSVSNSLRQPLFANLSKDTSIDMDGESFSESESEEEETEDSDALAFSLVDRAKKFDEGLGKTLKRHGYDTTLLNDAAAKKCLASAVLKGGRIISHKTRKLWVDREVPDMPPAFVHPGKLSLGDHIQIMNWHPSSTHKGKLDLYPSGKVTKVYNQKCLVTGSGIDKLRMPEKSDSICEEDRIQALELDCRGPYSEKEEKQPFPYVVKDDTIIIRFPVSGSPSGETEHHSLGFM